MELMGCAELAVPADVMQHVVRVESSFNPYAIGVVDGRLARQPRSLPEAVSTARMLEREGYNFSLGLAQVNRHNLASQGLDSYERAFDVCPNLRAGARILADCHRRAGQDWGKALSCYYSGNFVTGFRHGYVQKVLASWGAAPAVAAARPIDLVQRRARDAAAAVADLGSLLQRRTREVADRAGPAPGPEIANAALPPPAGAEVPSAPAAATTPHDAGPVIVQSMQAAVPNRVPASPLQHGAPHADAAFVFEQ
ncbi:transglycosylase SLT domain-containing protein [Luteimonas sp. SDU82]|uniref:lytic transglycosylase domain-containing protein n=1 Tax=Luteimonas sp. SDU82 TaxID=3422592 RepID=UPI003EC05072